MSATTHRLSSEIIGDGLPGYIPLISALKWWDGNHENVPEKTGPVWMELIMENQTRPKQTEEQSDTV